MKKQILLTALMAIFICLLSFQKGMTQTNTVQLYYAGDSTSQNYYCSVPATVLFLVYGTTGYYNPPLDSIQMYVNFGDGTDSLYYTQLDTNSQGYIWSTFNHVYTTPGSFSCQFIATAPDGAADTIVNNNAIVISNSCGNISGTVYLDANGNCIQDAGEVGIPYSFIEITDAGLNVSYVCTDSIGQYSLNVPTVGTYTITYNDMGYYSGYTVICPSSGEYNVTTVPSSGLDFALDCPNGFDLIGDLWGWGFRPGFTGYIWADVFNTGCYPVSGQVKLVIDPLLTYVNAYPAPDNIIGDTLIWNYTNLNSTGYYNWDGYYVEVTTSLSANIGDTVCNLIIAEPITDDVNPVNNIMNSCDPVLNSWDPNEKDVDQGKGSLGYVAPNTDLTYTVHFQNTGNAVAHNIYILDTLDSDLNPASIIITGSSHPVTFTYGDGNTMRFEFNNIMLPDSGSDFAGSNGYVRYIIGQKLNLPELTEITNTANIYFDFNPAIITNQTLNTVSTAVGINDSYDTETLSIYPVPADKILSLNIPSSVDHALLQIRDLEGRVIYKQYVSGGILGINVEKFKPGVYTVMLSSDTKYYSCKAMVIH